MRLFVVPEARIPGKAWGWGCSALAAIVVCLLSSSFGSAQAVTFGAQAVGSTSTGQAIAVAAQVPGTVSQVEVLTVGVAGLDFVPVLGGGTCAAANLSIGGQCTESVTFTPAFPGLRMGAVVLLDGNGNVLGTTYVSGTGVGGLGVFMAGNVLAVAGNGPTFGSILDGNEAISASLNLPSTVALDGAGNMLIADRGHNRIREVNAVTTRISTLAGNGTATFAGDGLASTNGTVSLSAPWGVALDGAGNVYIADTGNNRVRVISASTGIITTFAGNGTAGDSNGGQVGDNGPASAANLNQPEGVSVDAGGNLYIADTGNHRIRRVDANTGIIITVAGNGTTNPTTGAGGYSGDGGQATAAALNFPLAVAFDGAGDMLIPDSANNVVRMVNSSGIIGTFAGTGTAGDTGDGGAANLATLANPSGVAIDPAGNVYITDTQNSSIRKVSAATGGISTFVRGGSGVCLSGGAGPTPIVLRMPLGIYLNSAGSVLVADGWNMRIQEVQSNVALLDFTHDPILSGSQSAPQTQTIENDGNAALIWNSILPDANATLNEFATTCTTGQPALAVDETCQVSAVFAPSMPRNPLDGNINLAGDAVNSPMDIELVGDATSGTATTTLVASNLNPSGLGQAIIFTATVSSPNGVASLTGTVSFMDGANLLGAPVTVNAFGQATYQTLSLALGTHAITASYSGDSTNPASTSAILNQAVLNATVTVVVSSANPSGLGQGVTFAATVSGANGGATPTGGLMFFDGANPLGTTVTLNASGMATFATATLSVGTHAISASYYGDSANAPSNSAMLTQAVLEATGTVLTSSLNPSAFGQSVTFAATVTASGSGGIAPDGTVVFTDGNATLASIQLSTAGTATYTSAMLANGSHTVVATYNGDPGRQISGSISNLLRQEVLVSSQVAITSTPNPSSFGASVGFTITVTSSGSNVPTGIVNILDGGSSIGAVTLASGAGVFSTSLLAVGSHMMTAAYSGDSSNGSSTSPLLIQVVNPDSKAQTSTTVIAAPNPDVVGSAIAVTASVRQANGSAIPTGSVSFTDTANGIATSLGNATLSASGIASINTMLGVGSHSIVADYGGDTANAASLSAPFVLTVQPAASRTSLSSSADPSVADAAVTFTVTVNGGFGIPTGTVAVSADGVSIGSLAVNANGTAEVSTSTLAPGTHVIVASYAGDNNNAASTSFPINQVVDTIATATSLTASTGGTSLDATVTGQSGPVPTGTVTFLVGTSTLGTAQLDASGVATLTPALQGGAYTIVASYAGDTLHAPSISQPITVNAAPSTFTLAVTPDELSITTSATTAVTLTASSNFNDVVQLACTGLPTGTTCQFSSASVTLTSGSTGNSQLTISVVSAVARNAEGGPPGSNSRSIESAGVILPLGACFGCLWFRRGRKRGLLQATLTLMLFGYAAVLTTGCTTVQFNPHAVAYTIQVTGTGSASHLFQSQTVTLNVKP